MQTLHDESNITISYDDRNDRLYVNWVGDQDLDSVQSGCFLILRFLKEKKVQVVLNDNRGVTNRWAEAAEWVGRSWIPEMVNEGLRYFAWVLPANFDSRVSTELTIYYTNYPVIATFDSLNEARCWLSQITMANQERYNIT